MVRSMSDSFAHLDHSALRVEEIVSYLSDREKTNSIRPRNHRETHTRNTEGKGSRILFEEFIDQGTLARSREAV